MDQVIGSNKWWSIAVGAITLLVIFLPVIFLAWRKSRSKPRQPKECDYDFEENL